MALRTYDPKLVLITLGAIPISGTADGTFLNIEQAEDAFSMQVGSDGEATRTRSNNNSATITVTLMQSSASNDLLSTLHNLDLALPNGAGCAPLLVKDLSGRALFVAEKCWIVRAPSAEFGREAAAREWQLMTDDLKRFDGGN